MLKIIRRALENAGYQIHRLNRGQIIASEIPDPELYAGPEDFSRLFRPWLGRQYDRYFTAEVVRNTMLSRKKLYLLMKLFSQAIKLHGDVLEAGAGSGGSARLMLNCLADSKITRHMWLLDTFAGYQRVDSSKDGRHVHLNDCRCASKEEVERLLADQAATVHIIQGLIPDTLAQVKADKLCFAHIDVNLYEPTVTASNFVLERLVQGGIILFDDYCWPATYGTRCAVDEVCANHQQEIICVPESTQAFLIKN